MQLVLSFLQFELVASLPRLRSSRVEAQERASRSWAQAMRAEHLNWSGAYPKPLPAFWRVGRFTYDPGVVRPDGLMGAFTVTARGPHLGGARHRRPYVGPTE